MASIISCKRRREVLYLAHRESIAAHRGFIAHAMDARWARGGRRSTGATGAPSAMGKALALLAIPHPTRARCGSPILRDEVPGPEPPKGRWIFKLSEDDDNGGFDSFCSGRHRAT